MFGKFKFLENSKAKLPFAKNKLFKGEIGRNRPMKRRIAINDRDEASFDRNGVIKSHPSDQRSRNEVSPLITCIYNLNFYLN